MRVSLLKQDKIISLKLPKEISGSFWIEDKDINNKSRNLINISDYNGRWLIKSNYETKLVFNNKEYEAVYLNSYAFCPLKIEKENYYCFLYAEELEQKFEWLKLNSNTIVIGNSGCDINYNSNMISESQVKLVYDNNKWNIENLDINNRIYLNDEMINNAVGNIGDILFIMGLRVILMNGIIVINNPNNLVTFTNFEIIEREDNINYESTSDEELQLYEKDDYFFRAPRFKTTIEKERIVIDPPTQKQEQEEMPIIYTIGPMFTMGMTSAVTGVSTLNSVLNGNQSWSSALPSLIVTGAMLLSMMFWPMVSKTWQNRQKKKKEKLRQEKYKKYINNKKEYVTNAIAKQRQILLDNNLPIDRCLEIIKKRDRNLWERKIEHDDFLQVRLGLGKMEPEIELSYPEEHFTLEEDNLKDMLQDVGESLKTMYDVPISVNLTKKNISAIVGKKELTKKFIDGLLLKIMTFHSYDDLKIVLFTNKDNEKNWDYLKMSPYCFSDDRQVRFFATNTDEVNQLSNYLEQYMKHRKYEDGESGKESNIDYKSYAPYFLIITDDFTTYRNNEFIKSVLEQKINYGFSLIINNEKLLGLPNECSLFMSIDEKVSGVFENELSANKQNEFFPDIDNNSDMEEVTKILANISVEVEKEKYYLPKSISFLQMYNIGMVEQLNSLQRWRENNPITSLQAPVGVDENGDLFKLDLHEKFHGPHGLVAGMTGSGKSEFIITYILSMAVNYHPDEVSFALIDYKGGGLAGAFENKETGIVLPHLCGTITNLDTVEMKRSLASIQSELKRRQKIFNKAREISGESTIDIYKYQKLYRAHKVSEPVPHLFIISDEFAELKTQQPEFMEQLISTARIGRSLGVHLILATQKPAGVVDDQIWSNSKFRVCLKVQDKADSMDMIKRPDAAGLKEVGRFYLQVGYNEFFALGQSAWCGAPYYKKEKLKKKVDNSINFINDVGYVIKSIEKENKENNLQSYGEELPNIVKYLSDLAKQQNIHTDRLWLDSIPSIIYVDDLEKKYNYQSENYIINPIVGEYDIPNQQSQALLTMPLSKDGNAIIYGAVGSGKENMLNTLIYSIIKHHSSNEVNFYAIDCGAETLRMFNKAPHMGDILMSSEEDKIVNLFKMLKEELNNRKKLFADYNGSYETYNAKSGKPLPTIITIINYYEIFSELYMDYEDLLIPLTREGIKYGILFILTASGVNSIRYKVSQNFKQQFVLQLNDESDYMTVLGSTHGLYPSKYKGRGLVKFDDIYEFQTAYAKNPENIAEEISNYCNNITGDMPRAKKVPELPDIVTLDYVRDNIKDSSSIPIGIEKESLKVYNYNFKDRYTTLVSALDINYLTNFITTLIREFSLLPNSQTLVLDASKLLNVSALGNVLYENKKFDSNIDRIINYATKLSEQVKISNDEDSIKSCQEINCFIVGLDELKEKLGDNSNKLEEMMISGKKLGKINFILVDSVDVFKSYEYESWYKTAVNNSHGIWIGDGVSDQYSIKLSKITKELREDYGLQFGCGIKNGNATIIKVLGVDDNE